MNANAALNRLLGKHGHLNRGGIDVRGGEAQLDVGFEQVERGIGQRAEHAADDDAGVILLFEGLFACGLVGDEARDQRDCTLVDEGDDKLHAVTADDIKDGIAHARGEETVGRAENQAAKHAERVADVNAGSRSRDADEVGNTGQRGHQAGGAEHAGMLFARRMSHNENLSFVGGGR